MTHTYIALLRGINVGGNNPVNMRELKACMEAHGFRDVRTYINSGNVVFTSEQTDVLALEAQVQDLLATAFAAKPLVVLITEKQLREIVAQAPRGFGAEPASYRYDVIFFKAPLTPDVAIQTMQAKEGVDTMQAGDHAIYFSRLTAKATQSRLNRIIATPAYKSMTIRNWNTTSKLHTMLDTPSA